MKPGMGTDLFALQRRRAKLSDGRAACAVTAAGSLDALHGAGACRRQDLRGPVALPMCRAQIE